MAQEDKRVTSSHYVEIYLEVNSSKQIKEDRYRQFGQALCLKSRIRIAINVPLFFSKRSHNSSLKRYFPCYQQEVAAKRKLQLAQQSTL